MILLISVYQKTARLPVVGNALGHKPAIAVRNQETALRSLVVIPHRQTEIQPGPQQNHSRQHSQHT